MPTPRLQGQFCLVCRLARSLKAGAGTTSRHRAGARNGSKDLREKLRTQGRLPCKAVPLSGLDSMHGSCSHFRGEALPRVNLAEAAGVKSRRGLAKEHQARHLQSVLAEGEPGKLSFRPFGMSTVIT